MLKKIISLVLALTMMASISLCFVSCDNDKDENENQGNNPPEKTTYTVTVVDGEGNPVPGVNLTFTPKGSTAIPFPTDSEGKASYKTDKELTVTVTEIPTGYSYDKLNVAQSFGADGTLTVTLTALAPFVIKVVDQDGNLISGVKVQMCDSAGSCRMPRTTGEDGTVSYPYEEGDFHAQLTAGAPDGYTVDDPAEYYDFVDGVATITLTKIAE